VQTEPNATPRLLRLALHDALTYDATTRTGGANGSVRVEKELSHEANTGLKDTVDRLVEIKSRHDLLTYADVIHLAGVLAAHHAGATAVVFVPGRRDSRVAPPEGRLIGQSDLADASKFRRKLGRLELPLPLGVALLGSHPLGLALGNTAQHGVSHGANACQLESESDPAPWVINNTYFQALDANAMSELEVHKALIEDPEIKGLVELYAKNNDEFLHAYARAHTMLSVAGAELPLPATPPAGKSKGTGGTGTTTTATISAGNESWWSVVGAGNSGGLSDWMWYAGGAVVAVAGAAATYYYVTQRHRRRRGFPSFR